MAVTLRQRIKKRAASSRATTTTDIKKPPRKKLKAILELSSKTVVASVPKIINKKIPSPPPAATTDISQKSTLTSILKSTPSLTLILSLPEVCLATIFSFCPSYELSQRVPLVCKNFNGVATDCDKILWKSRCDDLWKNKVKTSYEEFANNDDLSHHQRYFRSIVDSKRCNLTAEELCTYSWAFRFKANAGNYWMDSIDPYWMHLKQLAIANNSNTNINNINANVDETENNVNGDANNNGANNNNNSGSSLRLSSTTKVPHMVRRFKRDGNVHSCSGATQDILEQRAEAMNMDIRWKLNKSRTWPDGAVKKGYFVSCGRTPSSGIERNPKDWGWVMQNQLVAFVYPSENLLSLHNTLEKDIERWT